MNGGLRQIFCTMASNCCFFSHTKKGRLDLSSALNKHNNQHIATNTQKPRLYVCSTRLAHLGFSGFPKFHSNWRCPSLLVITWFYEQLLSSFNLLGFAGRTAVYQGCVDWIMAGMTIMRTVKSPVTVRAQPHEDPLSNRWTAQTSCCWNDYARVCQAWVAKAPSVRQVI
jgi:hypothetical protein